MHILIAALHQPSKPTGVCKHAANLAQCLAETDAVSQVTLIVGVWQQDYFATLFSSNKINLVSIELENRSITRNLWFLFGLPRLVNILKEVGSSTCKYFSLEGDPVTNLLQELIRALQSPHDPTFYREDRFSKQRTASDCLKFYAKIN